MGDQVQQFGKDVILARELSNGTLEDGQTSPKWRISEPIDLTLIKETHS